MKNLYLNKKEMYDLIKGLVDQMIPGTKDGLMPPASKSVDIYHLQNYLNKDNKFNKILFNYFKEKKIDLNQSKKLDFLKIGTEIAKLKKIESLIGDKLINDYFISTEVLLRLSKRDLQKKMTYFNLISSSKILEEIIK